MLNDMLIADATAHCYNWTQENVAVPEAQPVVSGSWAHHQYVSADRPELLLTEAEFKQDWQGADLAPTLFFEAGIDLIGYHGTPIWDFFKDGHSDSEKGFVLRREYPNRVIAYAGMNPWGFETAREIRAEVDRLADAGATGLKLYAARYVNGATLANPMDDEKHAYPMIERAIERGIRAIASHKALPVGPVRYQPYGVDDFPAACAAFPEMNFEIVHAGMAFLEETTFLASCHKNCYFNLETSFSIITKQPRRFAQLIGALLMAGGQDRIVYASNFGMFHPILALESFLEFEMPEDLVADYDFPVLTDEVKAKILGLNYLRMHGIDPVEFRAAIADDPVSKRQANGLEVPWSNLRERAASVG
jgi:predicted TIM-barrel fold metal-dependent hydrolase